MSNIIDKIKLLEAKVDKEDCDGDCGLEKPWIRCENCQAIQLLNEIGEMLQDE